jgi:hypothetical protein
VGTAIKHNAILKLTHDEGMPYQLNVGERCYFKLDGLRIFQLYPTLITLVHEIDEKWKYAGLVQIMEQTIDAENNFTTGEFVISRVFDEEFSRAASLNEAPSGKSYYENQPILIPQ